MKKSPDPFVRVTLPVIPSTRSLLNSTGIPLVLSLTPFPSPSWEVHFIQKISLDSIRKCSKCRFTPNSLCQQLWNKGKWVCPACETENEIPPIDAAHFSHSVFDIALKDPSLQFVDFSPDIFILFIEISKSTFANNCLKTILEKILKRCPSCIRFTIFGFSDHLVFPIINHAKVSFTVARLYDLSGITLPPMNSLLFKFPSERHFLQPFINLLLNEPISPVSLQITTFIQTMISIIKYDGSSVHCVFSEAQIGDQKEMEKLGIDILGMFPTFHFYTYNSKLSDNEKFILSLFTINCNGSYYTFGEDQFLTLSHVLCSSFRKSTLGFGRIKAQYLNRFQVAEIYGCGIQKDLNMFELSSLTFEDTIYFSLDLPSKELNCEKIFFQFYVYFSDSFGSKFTRIITASFQVSKNISDILANVDFEMVVAASMVKSLSVVRETEQFQSFAKTMKEIQEKLSKNTIFRSKVDPAVFDTLIRALNKPQFFLVPHQMPNLMKSSPKDIALFTLPSYAIFSIDGSNFSKGILSSIDVSFGAMFVRVGKKHALILIQEKDDVQKWRDLSSHSPLKEIFDQLNDDKEIEVFEFKIFSPTMQNNEFIRHALKYVSSTPNAYE